MAAQNKLRHWREHLKLSQETIAAKATEVAQGFERPDDTKDPYSWGRTDVNKYENGKREVPLPFARAVAILCSVTVDQVLWGLPGQYAQVPAHLSRIAPVWERVEDQDLALSLLNQLPKK